MNNNLHIQNLDTYVTGSNSKFLSKDIITEFRDGKTVCQYDQTVSGLPVRCFYDRAGRAL